MTTRICSLGLLLMILLMPHTTVYAKEDKELRQQRTAAHKDRQDQRNQRNQAIADATKAFREYTRNLKSEYQAILKNLDTGFELKRVELQAAQDAAVAHAEAEYQKKWNGLFLRPGRQWNPDTIKEIEQEAKAYSDELFRLKKEAAAMAHREKMVVERDKHARLKEMDHKAMQQASSLGLTKTYAPILATPIGGELTRPEEQWNEREQKEVEKIHERNAQTVVEFRNGEALRAWERSLLEEDFRLAWEEKSELHALDSRQSFFNTLMMQAAQGEQTDQQPFFDQLAELAKKRKLIKIKYDQIRKQNTINRREEKKRLSSLNG
jgi:hypothetical protein